MNLIAEIGRHFLPARLIRVMRLAATRAFPSLVPPVNEESVYLRSEEELVGRVKGLQEIRDRLDALEIPFYLSGGALLGVVREGDFIKWDFDVDIDVKMEIVRPRRDALILALKEAGFDVQSYNPSWTDFKICAVKYGTRYEITGYLKMGGMRHRRRSRYPDGIIGEGSWLELRGERFPTFSAPEKYLEWFYGDWKRPKRETSGYVTDRSRTGPLDLTLIDLKTLFQKKL